MTTDEEFIEWLARLFRRGNYEDIKQITTVVSKGGADARILTQTTILAADRHKFINAAKRIWKKGTFSDRKVFRSVFRKNFGLNDSVALCMFLAGEERTE